MAGTATGYRIMWGVVLFGGLAAFAIGAINAATACPTGTTYDPETQFCCCQVAFGGLVPGVCYTQSQAWAAFRSASGGVG